eukprot:3598556-Amphidinium_carterae.1
MPNTENINETTRSGKGLARNLYIVQEKQTLIITNVKDRCTLTSNVSISTCDHAWKMGLGTLDMGLVPPVTGLRGFNS